MEQHSKARQADGNFYLSINLTILPPLGPKIMDIVNSSNDIKKSLSEIKSHLSNNKETQKGLKPAATLLIISSEVYELRSRNLSYNDKIEFSFQCNRSSVTQLFEVR